MKILKTKGKSLKNPEKFGANLYLDFRYFDGVKVPDLSGNGNHATESGAASSPAPFGRRLNNATAYDLNSPEGGRVWYFVCKVDSVNNGDISTLAGSFSANSAASYIFIPSSSNPFNYAISVDGSYGSGPDRASVRANGVNYVGDTNVGTFGDLLDKYSIIRVAFNANDPRQSFVYICKWINTNQPSGKFFKGEMCAAICFNDESSEPANFEERLIREYRQVLDFA